MTIWPDWIPAFAGMTEEKMPRISTEKGVFPMYRGGAFLVVVCALAVLTPSTAFAHGVYASSYESWSDYSPLNAIDSNLATVWRSGFDSV